MNKIEKIDKLIEEGKKFIGNNIYRDDPEFQSWNNSVIRFSEITFGKCSVTDNFKNRLYTFSCYGINTPRKDLVRQFEKDVKITLNDLGMNIAEAVTIFLKQVVLTDSIPFIIKKPKYNENLIEALKEAKDIVENPEKYKSYDNLTEILKDINLDDNL